MVNWFMSWYYQDMQCHSVIIAGVLIMSLGLVKGVLAPPAKRSGGWFDPIVVAGVVLMGAGYAMSYYCLF